MEYFFRLRTYKLVILTTRALVRRDTSHPQFKLLRAYNFRVFYIMIITLTTPRLFKYGLHPTSHNPQVCGTFQYDVRFDYKGKKVQKGFINIQAILRKKNSPYGSKITKWKPSSCTN